MEFIKELVEARMYRKLESVKGTDVQTLAGLMFDHMLMLKLLYYIDKPKAVQYAKNTMAFQNFKGFRQSQTDLYNIITLITEQKKYADKLFNNWDITLPELRLKRLLRDMGNGDLNERDFSQTMMILQRRFKGLKGDQLWMRRIAQEWNKQSPSVKRSAMTRILQTVRRPINTDLYMTFMQSAKITP